MVGARGKSLRAVDRDARVMAEMLRARRFAVETCTGEAATRQGILAAYDRLIAGARSDEPAVFYYTGHGFHAIVENEPLRVWQGICPVDVGESETHDFRGITAWELSIKLALLTRRTRNVTVILDCCYAGQMSRDAAEHDAVVRALPHPRRLGFAEHLRALRACYGAAADAVDPLGNRNAVRLAACRQDRCAFEYRAPQGDYRGAFTDALLEVLCEVGTAPVSWAALDAAIAARVQHRFSVQRPQIEGPARRLIFSLDEQDDIGEAAVIFDMGDGLQLQAGHLVGIAPGDVYGVVPSGSRTYREAGAIAEVRVRQTAATTAELDVVAWKNGHDRLPPYAIAIPLEKHAARHAVAIDAPGAARDEVERRIAATRTLRAVAAGDPDAFATLRVTGGALAIEGPAGSQLPVAGCPEGLDSAIEDLTNLAAAQRLRALEGEHGVLADEVEIAWGTVDRGHPQTMPDHGAALGLRDRIYVRVASSSARPLFVHAFNIGLCNDISSLTPYAPTGDPLGNGRSEVVIGNTAGALQGLGLSWPHRIPRDGVPRLDEIIVIVTSAPAVLRGLESSARGAARGGRGSKLEGLLAQLQDGLPRDTRGEQAIDGFLLRRLSYFLHPRDAVMADLPFEIDDNPLRQAAALAPGAWRAAAGGPQDRARPATEIEIAISDLVVENRHTLSSEVRIDALICTRSPGQAGIATWTQRCRGVCDGTRLVLTNPVVFRGAVSDFVDLHVWISRDAAGSADLDQLLAQRAAGATFREAAGSLLIGANGAAAPRVAAAGASAIIARIAGEVLMSVTGVSLRLWRTCLLAEERFGTGRHPAAGLRRGNNFAASLLITQCGIGENRQ